MSKNYTPRCPVCEGKLSRVVEQVEIKHPLPQKAPVRVCRECKRRWKFFIQPLVRGGNKTVQAELKA